MPRKVDITVNHKDSVTKDMKDYCSNGNIPICHFLSEWYKFILCIQLNVFVGHFNSKKKIDQKTMDVII